MPIDLTDSGSAQSTPESASNATIKTNDSPVRLDRVTFLLPMSVMDGRITARPLADYVKQLLASVETVAREQILKVNLPTTMAVTVAVKPSGDRRIWVDVEAPTMLSAELRSSFETTLREVKAPRPTGLIVFQVRLQLWGGEPTSTPAPWTLPEEWRRAASASQMTVEPFVEKIWDRHLASDGGLASPSKPSP